MNHHVLHELGFQNHGQVGPVAMRSIAAYRRLFPATHSANTGMVAECCHAEGGEKGAVALLPVIFPIGISVYVLISFKVVPFSK